MSHLEDASLQLEGAVGNVHHLKPVAVTDLLGVELFEQGKDLEVLFYLCSQLPGGVPLLLLNWEAFVR